MKKILLLILILLLIPFSSFSTELHENTQNELNEKQIETLIYIVSVLLARINELLFIIKDFENNEYIFQELEKTLETLNGLILIVENTYNISVYELLEE